MLYQTKISQNRYHMLIMGFATLPTAIFCILFFPAAHFFFLQILSGIPSKCQNSFDQDKALQKHIRPDLGSYCL